MTKFHILNVLSAPGHASLLMLAIPNASFLLILPMDPNMCTISTAHQLLQHLLYTMPNSILPPHVRCPVGNALPRDKNRFRCFATCGWKVHLKEQPKLTVSANTCPCYHATMEGVGRQILSKHLPKTWTRAIWSEEDDEEYNVPDPTVPLVYSQEVLMFTQQCHQEWDDIELPTDTVSSTKKQELGNRNLPAEVDRLHYSPSPHVSMQEYGVPHHMGKMSQKKLAKGQAASSKTCNHD